MSFCDGDSEDYWETRAKKAEVERDEAIARVAKLEAVLWVGLETAGHTCAPMGSCTCWVKGANALLEGK